MGRPRKYFINSPNPFGVKPGQIWESMDKRFPTRMVQVHQVREDYGYANVYVLELKKYRRVKLVRFIPRSNGYRLVKDV